MPPAKSVLAHLLWVLQSGSVKMKGLKPVLLLIGVMLVGSGCASWSHGWDMKPYKASGKRDLDEVKEYAERLEQAAVTRPQVQNLIKQLKYIVGAEPDNFDATVKLSQAWIVKAIGHPRDTGEQGDSLRRAITLAERAMSLNPDFLAAVRAVPKGKVSDAVSTLDASYAPAVATWSLATMLYFEESLSEVLKITNSEVLDDVQVALSWMEEKAPDYNGHVVLALKGMAAAVRSGADMVCVSANFDAAVQASPDSMLNLWLRSKYLYRNFKDKVSERTDLKAIRDLKVEYSPGFTPLNRMIRLMAEKKYKH
jgi:hypothetical protein